MARIAEQDYGSEASGPITGRSLQAIPADQVRNFNRDYDRLIDEELSARAARFLEMGREASFELTRHVMNRANQNYGGSLASGDEIGIRLIRPVDLDMGVNVATGTANSWLFTWAAAAAQDLFGDACDPIILGDNALAEGILIVGWTTNHPAPKTESIRANKFERDLVAQALPWDLLANERGAIKVMEANPWFMGLPGERCRFETRVFATGDDVFRALGTWITIGSNLRTL
jgi:hypothetical protein